MKLRGVMMVAMIRALAWEHQRQISNISPVQLQDVCKLLFKP